MKETDVRSLGAQRQSFRHRELRWYRIVRTVQNTSNTKYLADLPAQYSSTSRGCLRGPIAASYDLSAQAACHTINDESRSQQSPLAGRSTRTFEMLGNARDMFR